MNLQAATKETKMNIVDFNNMSMAEKAKWFAEHNGAIHRRDISFEDEAAIQNEYATRKQHPASRIVWAFWVAA